MEDLGLSEEAIGWIIRIVSATTILVVGMWLAYHLSKMVRRKAAQHPRIDTTLGTFFSLIIRYAIMIIVLLIVLQQFGVQTTSLVAVLGASALAIGLALQGTLTNVASGIMIALMRPYHIGDYVELNGKEGKVVDLDLFFTKLKTSDRTILIPNGQTVSNPIVNYTREGNRRAVIKFRVGYDTDIDAALEVMRKTVLADPRTLADPAPGFGIDAIDEYGITIQGDISVETDAHDDYRADMIKAIQIAFVRAGIDLAGRNGPSKPGVATTAPQAAARAAPAARKAATK